MHLYKGHLGGYYNNYKKLSAPELYCCECDKYDKHLGTYNTPEEREKLIKTYEEELIKTYEEKNQNQNNIFKGLFSSPSSGVIPQFVTSNIETVGEEEVKYRRAMSMMDEMIEHRITSEEEEKI